MGDIIPFRGKKSGPKKKPGFDRFDNDNPIMLIVIARMQRMEDDYEPSLTILEKVIIFSAILLALIMVVAICYYVFK